MKLFQIALYTSLALCSASAAFAQYGLYGSPEVLRMSQQNVAGQYATPAGYPTTATPMAGQMPSPAYYQSQAVAYQPNQPVAQRRYPRPYPLQSPQPYVRRPSRLTVARQPGPVQPIPAPPAAPAASTPRPAPVYANQPVHQGQATTARDNYGCGPYSEALGRFEQAACGEYPNDCGCGDYCGDGYYSPWYASFSALVMGRSNGRRLWTSYVDGDVTDQLANTQFNMQWKWGGEVRFGRRFCGRCCVPYALEATYWTTEAFSGHQYTTNPGGHVSTPLVVDPMTFGGVAAQTWFDGAEEHRLWRRNEFHNFEINLIREQLAWGYESPWDIGWSAGVRYFRFEEQLTFGSLHQGCQWGDVGGEAYFSDNITNNLLGVQFGFDAAYNVYNGMRLFITPKVGLYNNYMDQTFRAYTNDGRVGSGPYGSFPVHSTKNCISFLTQIDVGADWQFSRNWSARVGYRVVAVTGMGLADEQFPQYMVDTPEIANIEHNSSLVLHGAFFGVTYNY